jgi:hypothetical protein
MPQSQSIDKLHFMILMILPRMIKRYIAHAHTVRSRGSMSGKRHNRIKMLAQSLALVAGLGLSTAAYAVQTLTQTQTLTFTPTLFGAGPTVETETFNQFDTLGGRFVLQSVEVDWSTAFNSNITATSGSGNTRTMQTTASFTSSLTTAGNLFSFSNTISGTSPNYQLTGNTPPANVATF